MLTVAPVARLRSAGPWQDPVLRHKCACGGSHQEHEECGECHQKRLLQRTSTGTADQGGVPAIVHNVLRTPGRPLDAGTRAFMEPRFGHDFSQVRVHTDAGAAESASAVNARAYTVGRHIVFGANEYARGTVESQQLIAHELAHVVQHGPSFGGKAVRVSSSSENAEREATLAASAAVLGNAPSRLGVVGGLVLQRQEERPASVPSGARRGVGATPTRAPAAPGGGSALCSAHPSEAFYRTNPSFCMDTPSSGSMHSGFRCYREIPSGSGCPPGKHVCFDPATGACDSGQSHIDSTAPSITRNPSGMCDLSWFGACSIEHFILDVIPALLAEGAAAQAHCIDVCQQQPLLLQGFCMEGCTGGSLF